MKIAFSLAKLAAVVSIALAPGVASAQSNLDARYKDSDGDMVADTPSSAKDWLDPATLIFAYTPVEDPAVYAKVWDGFLEHMEKVTGKKRAVLPGAVERRADRGDARRPPACRRLQHRRPTRSRSLAPASCPFAMMASKDDEFGYEMEIITYPGSGIEKVEDIKGKKLAFTSETSNSGYKAPSALLRDQFKLEAGKDFEPVFSGKHDNSILGVANKDYPAAAIANSVHGPHDRAQRGKAGPDQDRSTSRRPSRPPATAMSTT